MKSYLFLVLFLIPVITKGQNCNVTLTSGNNIANPNCNPNELDWVQWDNTTANSANGTIAPGITVNLTQSNGGMFTTPNMFGGGLFPVQYSVPINTTTIANTNAGIFSFCFNIPVSNPQVAFSSIGNLGTSVPITTSVPYEIIWNGTGMSYPDSNTLIGTEGYTIIKFPGIHTCISFNYQVSESYCNIAFGIQDVDCQPQPPDPISLCLGESINLNANGATNYIWSPSAGLSSSTGANVIATPTTSTTYTVIDSDDPCLSPQSISISVNPVPSVSFTVTDVCLDNPSTFNNSSSISAPDNIFDYTWDLGDGNLSFLETPSHTYANEGTYSVNLFIESNNGCVSSLSQNVVVHPNPLADFNINTDCINVAAQFTDNSNITTGSITNWEWNFGDNSPISNNQSPSHLYANDGTYQPILIVTSNSGCKDTVQKSTIRHPIPVLNFTADPQCLYDAISFVNNTTINAPGSISNWIWNFGDGSPFSTAQNPQHQYNSHGVYNVTLIASSNFGCVGDISFPVEVYPIPIADFTANTICENTPPMNFLDLSSVISGSITNWQWNFDNGNLSTLQNPNNLYNQAGTYNVGLTVTSNNNCIDTITKPVIVNPKPTANFTVNNTEGCSPICIDFTDNSVSNATNLTEWQWNLGNGEVSSITNPSACYNNPSNTDNLNYTIRLIVKNDFNCYDTIIESNLITSWFNPIADFTPEPDEVNMYEAEINTMNNSIGADNYTWDFNNGTNATDFEPSTNYTDTGTYNIQLAVSSINNCVDTIIKPIKITPVSSLFIPNSFTPNGDGKNDTFIFKEFAIDISTSKFSIFDRWGIQVYYTENATPWDGTYKGQPAIQGTYIYQLTCKDLLGKDIKREGHVILLR